MSRPSSGPGSSAPEQVRGLEEFRRRLSGIKARGEAVPEFTGAISAAYAQAEVTALKTAFNELIVAHNDLLALVGELIGATSTQRR
jgi:hypothetical protein